MNVPPYISSHIKIPSDAIYVIVMREALNLKRDPTGRSGIYIVSAFCDIVSELSYLAHAHAP